MKLRFKMFNGNSRIHQSAARRATITIVESRTSGNTYSHLLDFNLQFVDVKTLTINKINSLNVCTYYIVFISFWNNFYLNMVFDKYAACNEKVIGVHIRCFVYVFLLWVFDLLCGDSTGMYKVF